MPTSETHSPTGLLEPWLLEIERPRTRADCIDAPRPCPFVACKFHTYITFNPVTGSIKINLDSDVEDLKESCVLDVADEGGKTLKEVGNILGLTRERIRQIESRGLAMLKARRVKF